MKAGFDEFNTLEGKLEGIPLPVSLDYVRKYENDWRTAIIEKMSNIEVKEIFTNLELANFYANAMRCGNYIDKLYPEGEGGKEYLFGREPRNTLLGEVYVVEIRNKRKILTQAPASSLTSRIHFYVKDLNNQIKIARLGKNPLVITDGESEILL